MSWVVLCLVYWQYQRKASSNFLALQSQLEGTENRIAVARQDYIAILKEYNLLLRSVLEKWILSLFADFKRCPEYTITKEKQVVPVVKFD